ncbi:nucleotidyltransferase family protein [Cohnella sp.]|uniref:nucleotidyltransferase family protein n=1 Tax=Cohnella sp. TaxID=1883426 RepID=UPI003561DC0D
MVIAFLQSLYHPETELPRDNDDYHRLLQDIELFMISSQVYHLLYEQGRLEKTPLFFQQKLKADYTRGVHHNFYMMQKEGALLKAFEQRQIDAIPLKGIQFADRYFGHFGARITGDIDIYIPLSKLNEAIECVKDQGYRFQIIKDHHARLYKHELSVELHWTFDKQYWSDLNPAPFWESSETFKKYNFIRQLSTQYTFYFICLHGARHQLESLRYLLDIVQMLYTCSEKIDYDLLFQQAVRDKTSRRIKTVLSIVYQQFPHLHVLKPLNIPLVKSRWNYDSIRKAKLGIKDRQYYVYKFFFKHLIFDSWKHTLKSIRKSY